MTNVIQCGCWNLMILESELIGFRNLGCLWRFACASMDNLQLRVCSVGVGFVIQRGCWICDG